MLLNANKHTTRSILMNTAESDEDNNYYNEDNEDGDDYLWERDGGLR